MDRCGGFPKKETACFIILLGFIFVIEFPVLHLIEIDRFVRETVKIDVPVRPPCCACILFTSCKEGILKRD